MGIKLLKRTSTMSGKNYKITYFLGLLFLFSCHDQEDKNKDTILLRVGDYEVSYDEFNKKADELLASRNGFSEREINLLLFDNYISAGLLVESAKKGNYTQDEEFVGNYDRYKKQLILEYNQLHRVEAIKLPSLTEHDPEKYFQDDIKMDYVRIPQGNRELSTLMAKKLRSGDKIENILNSSDIERWNKMGLSFYNYISIDSVLLTKKILDKIIRMKENEVTIIKTKSADHIIRFLERLKRPTPGINKDQTFLNLKMAYALDNGDILLDKYTMKNAVKCNQELLLGIDFSVQPVLEESNTDSDPLAVFFERTIRKEEVMKRIPELPQNIRGLFRNRSTRINAVAALILSDHRNDIPKIPFSSEDAYDNAYQSVLIDELKKSSPKDTISFFREWIGNELRIHQTNSIAEVLKSKIQYGQFVEKITNNQYSHEDQTVPVPGGSYMWFHPEILTGYGNLKLNFRVIGNMRVEEAANREHEILAYSGQWKLTVEQFRNVLSNLTPKTRIAIARNGNASEMIRYLAEHEANIHSTVTINMTLLNSVDMIGNSIDSLRSAIIEDDIVGSLGDVSITVKDLRYLAMSLPEIEKKKLTAGDTRRETFNDLIINKFWLNRRPEKETENDAGFAEALKKYENLLLAEMLYQHEIQVKPLRLKDKNLDILFRKAIKVINDERLKEYIQRASTENRIEINRKIIADLNIDLSVYEYVYQLIN
ncbi:MAG: hypothetical protein AB2L24_20475 [Mangrovibacterium sp.]